MADTFEPRPFLAHSGGMDGLGRRDRDDVWFRATRGGPIHAGVLMRSDPQRLAAACGVELTVAAAAHVQDHYPEGERTCRRQGCRLAYGLGR